jgi:hypothetical protein
MMSGMRQRNNTLIWTAGDGAILAWEEGSRGGTCAHEDANLHAWRRMIDGDNNGARYILNRQFSRNSGTVRVSEVTHCALA